MGSLALVKSDAESTAGRVAVIEHVSPPGSGSPLHRHTREDEWFYVIDGELTFAVGDEVIPAPAGSFVYGPRGIPHTFMVTSSTPARFLLVTEPAGFEGFMRACPRRAARPPTSPRRAPGDGASNGGGGRIWHRDPGASRPSRNLISADHAIGERGTALDDIRQLSAADTGAHDRLRRADAVTEDH